MDDDVAGIIIRQALAAGSDKPPSHDGFDKFSYPLTRWGGAG